MGSILKIRYAGKEYPDFSFIRIGEQEVQDKPIQYRMDIINPTALNTRKFVLQTNLPDGSYESEIPKEIKPYSEQPMTISINTKKVMEDNSTDMFDPVDKVHRLIIELEYEKVREFA